MKDRDQKPGQEKESGSKGIADPPVTKSDVAVRGDNPICCAKEDVLGRTAAALSFGKQLVELDVSEGVVVGVLGPWGSGKTSFFNLARPGFDAAGVAVLEFNPWMFSGAHQLVESFFTELAAQLKLRPELAEVGKDFAEYGEIFAGLGWLPVVGSWIERARVVANLLGTISKHRKDGIGARRSKIEKALANIKQPIIIFVDDVDRLSTPEITDIFKLIRLTANFPNLIYVVAFDRRRVEQALSEEGVPGRLYLEKILQVAIDLPAIPEEALTRVVLSTLDVALAGIDKTGQFDERAWADIFAEIVRPLLRNMRDIRRYAMAVRGAVTALEGEVALADVLGLEAVRVFLPDVFANLHGSVEVLTTTADSSFGSRKDSSEANQHIKQLVEIDKDHQEIVRSMVRRLFPAAQRHIGGSQFGDDWKPRWQQEHRVAHEDFLKYYLERVAGEGLENYKAAEHAWTLFADRDRLDGYLRSLEKARWQDIIASLEVYEDKFQSSQVVPATTVLLNLLPDLPQRQRGMLELGPRFAVTRVTFRLLRSLKDPVAIEAAVREVIPNLTSLSSKLELIQQVGHRENVGHKLISEGSAAELEKLWRAEVRAATIVQLVEERDLLGVLYTAKQETGSLEGPLTIPESPELTVALVRSASGEVVSQSAGNRAVRRTPRLSWEALVRIYGDEEALLERIRQAKAKNPSAFGNISELVDKYLSGWRPNRADFAP